MSSCNLKEITSQNKINKKQNFILVGCPNVGKSTFFNRLTWKNAPIGNADRITVSGNSGSLHRDKSVMITDLPGIYTLNPSGDDEKYSIKTIFNCDYTGLINVISASSLKRDLYLTTQLLEAGIVNEIVINMVDETPNKIINIFKLSQKLKTSVNLVSSTKNIGIKETIKAILTSQEQRNFEIEYNSEIEEVLSKITKFIPENASKFNSRFLALAFIESNAAICELFKQWNIWNSIQKMAKSQKWDLSKMQEQIRAIRIKFIEKVINFSITKNNEKEEKITRKNKIQKFFDEIILNKWSGLIIFFVVIAAIYYITFGEYAGGFINDQLSNLLDQGLDSLGNVIDANPNISEWVRMLIINGLLGGIATVISFIPYIFIMFTLIAFIEQTGYLARVSLILDKQFAKFGISGRSIITLITGVGCNVPSILMARNCHSIKERRILLLIAPLMSCSARLLVFIWIIGAFIPSSLTWLAGIAFTFFTAIITLLAGLFFSQTAFRKRNTFLLTELPLWRAPHIITIFKRSIWEIFDFIKRVIIFIFIANLIMFLLMYISPTKGLVTDITILSQSQIDWSQATLLQYLSLPFQYLFYPIGLGEDWRLASSLLAAAPAKEIAASNIALMFTGSEATDLVSSINFKNALFGSGSLISLPIATLVSYLIFFAFYTPCISTAIVIKKEGGQKNMLIHIGFAFVLAYLLSLVNYALLGSIEKIFLIHFNSLIILFIVGASLIVISSIYLLLVNVIFKHKNNKFILTSDICAGAGLGVSITLMLVYAFIN